jgi:hypothetical protein
VKTIRGVKDVCHRLRDDWQERKTRELLERERRHSMR